MGTETNQHRLLRLVDLIVGADANRGKILVLVVNPRLAHGGVDDVGDAAHRQGEVQDVSEELHDAAEGTVTNQHQAEDDLAKQGLGDRDRKQDALGVAGFFRGEGVGENPLRLAGLLVDELAADVVVVGEAGDRLGAGEGVHGQALTLVRGKVLGVAGEGPLRLGSGKMGIHVCFLLRTGFLTVPV
jgi:hypothetical protein